MVPPEFFGGACSCDGEVGAEPRAEPRAEPGAGAASGAGAGAGAGAEAVPHPGVGNDNDADEAGEVDEAAKALAYEKVAYCRWGCGKGIHRECMRQWIAHSRNECIYCQAWWTD